jgi:hypothetical protein
MNLRLISILSLVSGLAASALAAPAHLASALLLVDEITTAQAAGIFTDADGVALNRYGGSWNSAANPSFIHFADAANGVPAANNTTCAPLVTHLLKSAYQRDWSGYSFMDPILPTAKTTASPAPYQYIALTKQGQGMTQVLRLDQAQPGDLLHWWRVGTEDNDHSMLIVAIRWNSAKPYPANHAAADPTLAGTTYYEVVVVDSSSGVHTDDSRLVPVNGTVTQIPGIGTGVIGLLVDAHSQLVGYTWSLPTSDYVTKRTGWLNGLHSRLRRLPDYEAVIGRYTP